MMEESIESIQNVDIEYNSTSGELKMNVENSPTQFNSLINELEIYPRIVEIGSLKINKGGILVKFTSPVICKSNGDEYETKMLGVRFDGKIPDDSNEDFSVLKSHMFSEKWQLGVERQREKMENRRKRLREI